MLSTARPAPLLAGDPPESPDRRAHRPVGVAVVGAGRWGRNHVRELARLPGAELRWICDLDAEARAAAGSLAPDALATAELDPVLDDRRVEAVVVATDSARHAAPVRAALTADKHVLVEKPLSLELPEALELVALSTARRRRLMVGHLLAYHPAVVTLGRLIGQGALGEVRYLSGARTSSGRREAGGVLYSLGPHDLGLIDLLLPGTPTAIAARGVTGDDGLTEAAFVSIALSDGSLAELQLSWIEPRLRRRLTVVGSRATAVFDDTWPRDKLRLYRADGRPLPSARIETAAERESSAPLTRECERFAAWVATGEPPATTADHALRVCRLLDTAREALVSGLPTTVSDSAVAAATPVAPCQPFKLLKTLGDVPV